MIEINRENQLIYETVVLILKKRAKIKYEIANSESEVSRITKQVLIHEIDKLLCSETQDII